MKSLKFLYIYKRYVTNLQSNILRSKKSILLIVLHKM